MRAIQLTAATVCLIFAALVFGSFVKATRRQSESARARWSMFAFSIAAFVWMGLSLLPWAASLNPGLNDGLKLFAAAVFVGSAINYTAAKNKEKENAQSR
jgi:hypothetical protein